MVQVRFLTKTTSDLDARTARLFYDLATDEAVGDPQVMADYASVNLASGAILSFDGNFAALQTALQSTDSIELLLLSLPLMRIDTILKSFAAGESVLVTDLGINGDELAQFFSVSAIEDGFQHFLSGNDTFVGDMGQESMAGYAGNDLMLGMNGNDLIEGGIGDDEINGNKGSDIVDGGPDRDFVRGGQESDLVLGGDGSDWHLNGNNANDTVQGGNGGDVIFGGKDDDLLMGQEGDDFLSGDLGNDVVVGGNGADVFAFDHDSGLDFVFDFRPGEGDVIGIREDVNGLPIRTGTDVLARALQSEEGTVLDLGGDNFVLLDLVQRSSLREEHFAIF